MYSVSEKYKSALKSNHVQRALKGYVGDADFTDQDIINDTFSVSNQCSESGEIKLGSVYTAMLECTFKGNIVERETWKGLKIEASEGIILDDGNPEYVPLGIFTIDEAVHQKNGISVIAYDNMILFEKAFGIDTLYGTPYDFLKLACTVCGVPLGMRRSEVENLPNGRKELSLYAENDIETWRDFVFWISQTLCCFATINRSGGLELRCFGCEVIDTVPENLRFSDSRFSDFVTEYSGIRYMDAETRATVFADGDDSKLVYDIGANPFIQYGSDTEKKEICSNILSKLKEIHYVPFAVRMLNGPVYDLGDVFRFTGGLANGKQSCIMLYDYGFKSNYSAEGFGSNPATVCARSKVDKQLQGIINSTKSEEIQFYHFTNAAEILIQDGNTGKICDIKLASLKTTRVVFVLESSLNVDTTEIESDESITFTDADLTVTYVINDVETSEYHPAETYMDGRHVLHLMYYLTVESNIVTHFVVKLRTSGGKISIGKANVKAVMYGQGLAGTDYQDGNISIEQSIRAMDISAVIGQISVAEVYGSVSITDQVPEPRNITEMIPMIALAGPGMVQMSGMTDTITVGGLEEE